MNWIPLEQYEQLEIIKSRSITKPQVIFKHSTTCSISSMIKNRLERTLDLPEADYYYLDLLTHRSLSDGVAHTFGVEHESPQILLIQGGKCVYTESHYGIMGDEIAANMLPISK